MRDPMQGEPPQGEIEQWEFDLIKTIALGFDTTDRGGLESDLALHLLRLKRRRLSQIQNWKAFLRTAFRRKASNWLRNERTRNKHLVSLDKPVGEDADETLTLKDILKGTEFDPDQQIVMAQIRQDLAPELSEIWDLLSKQIITQAEIARRLRLHRNTVRARIRRIQQILIQHGFNRYRKSGLKTRKSTKKLAQEIFVIIPWPLVRALMRLGLTGTDWRIVLWVIRQTSLRKQRTVPFNWAGMAKALALNRPTVWRAGQGLLRARALFIENGRIGLHRNLGRKRRTK